MIEYTVSGEPVVVYPVGTRVRYKGHPEAEGIIKKIERHESGCVSPIPFYIEWDDVSLAREVIGGFWWWASSESVEVGDGR